MVDRFSVLCVHGIGHGDADDALVPSWRAAVTQNIHSWNPTAEVVVDFMHYDELFDQSPNNPLVYAEAVGRLLSSGIVHGIGDLFSRSRGLFDLPALLRWTAGMIAQWAANDALRDKLRTRLLTLLEQRDYQVVCSHSLGSLICYDTFRRKPAAIRGRTLLTFGSQIGNPFVRDSFAGRIEGLDARTWFHLYNREDHVFTAPLRINSDSFTQVETDFDKPNDPLNHDALYYLNHASTRASVWRQIAGARSARALNRVVKSLDVLAQPPARRALLIGINDYPDPQNRLEGCVNDVFLMSAMLQECGFAPDEIRVVLDARATTANILERMHWLLDDVPSGAERVLFYSGHGAQIPAYNFRGEPDHLDECLVPYDFDWSPEHAVRDDQFVELYSQLPYDSHFVGIFDCCHSGGMTRQGGGPRVRGIDPPDDIRHRALRWNVELGMWQDRDFVSPNRALASSTKAQAYLGQSKATYRLGRGVGLRGLHDASYDDERRALRHKGAYLPTLLEACREQQLSYEYRDGATSYGAYTYSLVKLLREHRTQGENLSFRQLSTLTAGRLKTLGYEQTPCLVGPRSEIGQLVPWTSKKAAGSRAKPARKTSKRKPVNKRRRARSRA